MAQATGWLETIRPRLRLGPIGLGGRLKPGIGTFVMAITILLLGTYLISPILILLVLSFNTARDVLVGPAQWGADNWINVWSHPRLLSSLWNSFLIWFLVTAIAFPIAIAISLILARTRIPFPHGLEFMFWIAFIFPNLASTLGWMMLLSPDWGFLNKVAELLPFVDKGPFNIFSVAGIVWARLMADGIAFKVILLTPAFRNMDGALEEAGRVSGASGLGTMLRITLPVMISPIVLVLALQLIRIFQGFETEWLLGAPWGFFVYSTLIYQLVQQERVPQYADAVVLASITLLVISLVIPLQRWILQRRPYTTVSSSFRPGLIDLGHVRWVAFGVILLLILMLTVVPTMVLVVGSFMARVGFFDTTPLWTLRHWQLVFANSAFLKATGTTLILATTAAIASPILFSILAYMIVRTRWRGRAPSRLHHLELGGDARNPAGIRASADVPHHPRPEMDLRDHLAASHRGDRFWHHHRRERLQGRAGPARERPGGGGAGLRGRLAQDLLPDRDPCAHANDGPHRDVELRIRRWGHIKHHPARITGHQDAVDPDLGACLRDGWPAGGGRHHQSCHHGAHPGPRTADARPCPAHGRPPRSPRR